MRRIAIMAALLSGALTFPVSANDLVPTGTLRATYIGQNPVQAFIDPVTKQVRGPAAEITRALAQRLGVPFEIKGVQGAPGVINSVKNKEANIGFVAYDPTRAAEIDFSQTYSLAQNTYLVPGLRIVDGNFYGVEQAVGVFKGTKALLDVVDEVLDEARTSGLIAGAIERADLSGVDVAPPRDQQKR